MQLQYQSRKKLEEYPKKAILARVPQGFIGIAKQLSDAKKNRIMSQQILDSVSHELSSIEKINKNLAKNLNKKKKQLKYAQQVRNRFISESIQKEKLNERKGLQLQRMRKRTSEEKITLQFKLSQAKEKLFFRKKTQFEQTKRVLSHYKSQKQLDEEKLNQQNHSRVKDIQMQKLKARQNFNRFFQSKNKKILVNYRQLISTEKNKQEKHKSEMKQLENKLLLLKQDNSSKKNLLDKLSNSIQSLRQQSRQSVRSFSRVISTRSMTPMEIITKNQNPQKQKLRLIYKY